MSDALRTLLAARRLIDEVRRLETEVGDWRECTQTLARAEERIAELERERGNAWSFAFNMLARSGVLTEATEESLDELLTRLDAQMGVLRGAAQAYEELLANERREYDHVLEMCDEYSLANQKLSERIDALKEQLDQLQHKVSTGENET